MTVHSRKERKELYSTETLFTGALALAGWILQKGGPPDNLFRDIEKDKIRLFE